MRVLNLSAREILDSEGLPAIEVEIETKDGTFRAAVSSSSARYQYLTTEVVDGDMNRYMGMGMLIATTNVQEEIAPAFMQEELYDQDQLDRLLVQQLDKSRNEWGYTKSNLGINVILSCSLAGAKAMAAAFHLPLYKYFAISANLSTEKLVLPVPILGMLKLGSQCQRKLVCREIAIIPESARSFKEALEMGYTIYHKLKSSLDDSRGRDACRVDADGMIVVDFDNEQGAFESVLGAINDSYLTNKVKLYASVAASEIYSINEGAYFLEKATNGIVSQQRMTSTELTQRLEKLCNGYPIVAIEDPLGETDWRGYKLMTSHFGERMQIVRTESLASNAQTITLNSFRKLCNALHINVNRIGTVTETIELVRLANKSNLNAFVGLRWCTETEDSFVADLTVGLRTGQLKCGAPCSSQWIPLLNRMLRIEDELGTSAIYAGNNYKSVALQ